MNQSITTEKISNISETNLPNRTAIDELRECLESLKEMNRLVDKAKKRKLARQNEGY